MLPAPPKPLLAAALATLAVAAALIVGPRLAAIPPETGMRTAQAAFGEPDALADVAEWLAEGNQGLPAAPALARFCRERAADQGHVEAMIAHALDLGLGRLGPADPDAAREWLAAAEARADPLMRRRCARAWAKIGDQPRALALYREFARAGDARACWELARTHLARGEAAAAEPWLARLRTARSPAWCAWVAARFERGGDGLAPDPARARAWRAYATARRKPLSPLGRGPAQRG